MQDLILRSFLERQYQEGMALAAASDLMALVPLDPPTPTIYIVQLHSKGLVKSPDGTIAEADSFEAAVRFGPNYLRSVNPFEVITWMNPRSVFHPNILPPLFCPGRLTAGTSLVDIIYQIFEIVGYTKVTMKENDALNFDACAWARQNKDRFPIEKRPLKRRIIAVDVRPTT